MAREDGESASTRAKTAPDPEDPRKPDSPTDIEKPSWAYIAKKTLREFSTDHGTDLAASLTYYATLAVFPALLAFVSIIGLFGDAEKTTNQLLGFAEGLIPPSTLDVIRAPIENLAQSDSAGFALVIGILGALWSASGYVGAFSRAMNRIYGIQEGRPIWKLRPITLLVTVLAVLVAVIAAILIVLSGPIAENVADAIGLGETPLIVWNIVKWPVVAFLAVLVVAVLYYATPNVQQPKFRWMSVGSLAALLVWLIASLGFAFYAANFSNYNATYGSIGGVIVFLLWIWISNLALLFGAELDAELERGRELQAGIAAEETIQLPPRDTRVSDKQAKQHEKDVAAGRSLRKQIAPDGPPPPPQRTLSKRQLKERQEERTRERKERAAQEKGLKRATAAIHATLVTQQTSIRNPAPGKKQRKAKRRK
jgi:membrane protein